MESKDYKLQTYKRIKNDYPQVPKLSKIYMPKLSKIYNINSMNKC